MKSRKKKENIHISNRLITLLLSGTLSLSMNNYSPTIEKIEEDKDKSSDSQLDYNISSQEFSDNLFFNNESIDYLLKSEQYQDYLDYNLSVDADYFAVNYYPTEQSVRKQYQNFKNDNKCSYIYDNNIEKIISDIKQNSSKYLHENQYYQYINSDGESVDVVIFSAFDEEPLIEEYFKEFIDLISESKDSDINEDICSIKDLKIIFGNIPCTGLFNSQENLIVLSKQNIINQAYENYVTYEEELKLTLFHELNHRRQVSCDCRNYKELTTIDNLPHTSFYLESSAESWLYNIENPLEDKYNYSYCYIDERKYESSLLLLGLGHDCQDINDYYKAICDTDLDKFYSFLGVNNMDSMLKVNRIIYALDTMAGRTKLFIDNEDDKDNEGFLNYIENTMDQSYKIDLFSLSINNLMRYTIEHDDFLFRENILLFNIVKNYISSDFLYYGENKDELLKINDLENNYISFLSSYYNLSIEEIRDYENNNISKDLEDITNKLLYNQSTDMSLTSENVMKKFPLLENIIYPFFDYSPTTYNELLDKSNIVLQKN